MFESLELFVEQKITLDHVLNNLVAFRYQKVKKSTQEGEFSQRGGILDVYPVGFDGPVRIDFDDDTIRAIASINMKTGKWSIAVWNANKETWKTVKKPGANSFGKPGDIPVRRHLSQPVVLGCDGGTARQRCR